MKTMPFLFTGILAIFICSYSCNGQSNVVFYGANTNALGVSYADTNLTLSAQTAIVADLQLCLQNWGRESYLSLGADETGVVGYLERASVCPHYPENIEFPKNVVSNGTSGLALQIPKSLSDAYTNAFAFASANSNIVAAAYTFVSFVSSSNFVFISSNALPNYIMFKNGLPDTNAESNAIVNLAPQIIPDLCHQTYFAPSVLGFCYSSEGPAATNLWMKIPCSSVTQGGYKEWSGLTAIWHNGKWKFCTWLDWVP